MSDTIFKYQSLITILLFVSIVKAWMLRLTFSSDGAKTTRVQTFEQLYTSGTQKYLGAPTHTNKCIDIWTPVNKPYVDAQHESGIRQAADMSDELIKYGFIGGVFNPTTFMLFFYNDTNCEGLTPKPGAKGQEARFNRRLNAPHAVYDLAGLSGTTLKKPRKVQSFYVATDTPRYLYKAAKGNNLMSIADSS
ncbi:hypothetical protein EYR41_002563 [Orbilia oligospora]|uniref:Uncharacterized protein n=1 Tax=Orbilia oligospora TaxID=2813651 RepID=A0A7C8PUN4_ORBOL|nr:hypothetical protein TWF751_011619 [Orbilia oligospora]KAF3293836.1 hypothetical protein TWF132_004422 [Orbilia oligospora]TGJ70529.1 hypothetical protein EYR41_002563 [Orbilia oligospora]